MEDIPRYECNWKIFKGERIWKTTCGMEWIGIDYAMKNYCHNCGGKLNRIYLEKDTCDLKK